MNILITGASGMVGKNLLEVLENSTDYKLMHPSSSALNLLNPDSVDNFIKTNDIDIIIHCAGLVGGIQANIERPYSFLSFNLHMGLNLIETAIKYKIPRLINLGSSCMYPKDSNEHIEENQLLAGKLEPTNEGYAIAKIATSKLAEYAKKEFGLSYKTLIPCNLYGRHDKFEPENSHMIPAVIRKIHEAKAMNKTVEIWGDGSARREFMYAEDLADFIKLALYQYNKLDTYTNVGLGYDYSILEYYQAIAKVVSYEGEFRFNLDKPSGMKRKLCSVKKQNLLGWEPKHSLLDGLEKTNKFYIEKYGV